MSFGFYDRDWVTPVETKVDVPKCTVCGDDAYDATYYFNGDIVCDDCKSDYLEGHAEDYADEYIKKNEAAYYLEWWFNNLEDVDKLKIVKSGYRTIRKEGRIEFCRESDDFHDFIEGELK